MKQNRIIAVLLAICLSVSGCGTFSAVSEQQQALKQEGMELHALGDYEGAIQKYDEALGLANMEAGPEEFDIACYKASAQYRNGDIEGAIATYTSILALEENEDIYLGRGILYIRAKDAERAEEDLNKMMKKTSDPLIKGIIWQIVEQYERAKECFEEAKDSGNPEGLFYLAGIYEKEGDSSYAMVLLEEYIASGKASAEGYLSVGQNYFESGSYTEALKILESGIALGESGVLKQLLQEEIACYEMLGDFETAKEKVQNYLEKYPDDVTIKKEYEFLKTR